MPNKPAQAKNPKKNQILALNLSALNIINISGVDFKVEEWINSD